jgi:2-oxoglutarate ferredoxin oxidoreductase subunit gamma
MIEKSIFAGFGGQGILMMGYTLAYAAMIEEKSVTYLPSYGAEVRGGTAHCTVSIGDEDIASPIASVLDFLAIMNAPSLNRFQNMLKKGGDCLVNTSLVHKKSIRSDIKVYELSVSEMAEDLGDIRCANMIMLGAFLKVSGQVEPESVLGILQNTFRGKKKAVQERNENALWSGYRAIP